MRSNFLALRGTLAAAAVVGTLAGSLATSSAALADVGIGNCYVRIDGGYGWRTSDEASATTTTGAGTGQGGVRSSSFDDNWFGDVGFGCRILRREYVGGSIKDAPVATVAPSPFRGDMTYSYIGERRSRGFTPLPAGAAATVGETIESRLKSSALMFNAYYDLPTMMGVMPYVGAGIGIGFLELHDVVFTGSTGATVQLPGSDDTTLAWSLMAGFAVDLGSGVTFDMGYRYLDLDGIGTHLPPTHAFKLDSAAQHQIKMGLRVPATIWFD